MARDFKLTVVSHERSVVDTDTISVIVPGEQGYLGIQYGHEPIVLALKAGIVMYRNCKSEQHFIAIDGGFLHMDGKNVSILADNAICSNDIDESAAEKLLESARQALRGEASGMNTGEATQQIERATARLKAARMKNFN